MGHISEGGVSDVNVDPDYVAPPGMAPERAIEMGIPSAGEEQDDEQDEKRSERESDNVDKRDENDNTANVDKSGETLRLGNDDVARPTASTLDADASKDASKPASARKPK
jgi:hypothetical protein